MDRTARQVYTHLTHVYAAPWQDTIPEQEDAIKRIQRAMESGFTEQELERKLRIIKRECAGKTPALYKQIQAEYWLHEEPETDQPPKVHIIGARFNPLQK